MRTTEIGKCAPPIGTTPGIRRPVRTITWPPMSSRRMRFGLPTSPPPSGVTVAAFRPSPASRIAVAASCTTAFSVARRLASERSKRGSSSSSPITSGARTRSDSSRSSWPVSSPSRTTMVEVSTGAESIRLPASLPGQEIGAVAKFPTQDQRGWKTTAGVTFDRVSKIYPDGTRACSRLDLEVEDGEFMVLVGPSGCGKTTALRMVAGLEEISEGTLQIGDRVVNHVPPRDRDIAMVFQSYALYPHLTVYENIAFGLRLRKEKKGEIDKRVHEAAKFLGLEPYLKRKPRALSGGQRQRVAMGRAIVRRPQAFL